MTSLNFDALVVGGGIIGRCTLYHLQRLGLGRVGLVEQFGLEHDRGSSHSHSRITRSAYVNADYVRLMQVAHTQEWPRLEAEAGQPLILPTDGCFFGAAGSKIEAYARAVADTGVDCELLDVGDARTRFPMFRFPTAAAVLHDHTAGVIAASRTMASLLQLTTRAGATLLTDTRVLDLDVTTSPIRLTAQQGEERLELRADRVVICPGPWATQLLPFLRSRLQVIRQTVGYFVLSGAAADFEVGRWPVWGNLGAPDGEIFYGLPAFGREGIKIARHVIAGTDDTPDQGADEVDPAETDRLRQFIEREFVPPVKRLVGAEHCYYTNTKTEDYIVDLHPDTERVAIGAGFSGHGFKLAPVCGRVLAELVTDGRSSIAEFEAMRRTFSIDGPPSSPGGA
jgi:sarcosine oxidase